MFKGHLVNYEIKGDVWCELLPRGASPKKKLKKTLE